jgi:integrase/recombinase XerD
VEGYLAYVARYLKFVGTDKPTQKNFDEFKEAFLFNRHLSRSSINNYYCTIMQYHKMLGDEMKLPLLKNNEHLPFYFDEDDMNCIFMACRNLKHFAMLQTLFFGCLRASELCHLEDRDLDLENHTIRILEIIGLRNRLIHGYDAIDYEILWHILNHDLPELVQSLERTLGTNIE